MVAPLRIDGAARLRLLADGLRVAGEGFATRAHMDVWPIFPRLQLRHFDGEMKLFAKALTDTRALVSGAGDQPAPIQDALRGVEALEQLATGDALRTRAGLRRLGEEAIALANQIETTLPASAADVEQLATARRALFARFEGGAADMGSARAREVAELLPPEIAGPATSGYLGVSTAEHASEFVRTTQKLGRLEASTFERERLGMIELMGQGTPEAAERLRGIVLDIVSADPKDLKAPAWQRLAMLLELDSTGRILDGPRELGGSARSFPDAARAIADSFRYRSTPRFGSVTRQYFEQWRSVLGAHRGVDGAPLRPAGTDPNAERIFQLREPEPLQLVQDLGKVGSSSFAEIRTALEFVERRMATVAGDVPAELNGTVADTRRLVSDNLKRLDGALHDGYGRHPEYAELGRVRSNAELIEQVLAARAGATVAETASRPAAQVVDDVERIAW